jgi:5-methylcytosine-specific restriction endonuclease McrA
MTEAIKTTYDTLTTNLRRGPDGGRTAAHYHERWLRRQGLQRPSGGGKLEKFRRIAKYHCVSVMDTIAGRLPRVAISEYHYYRWNVGKILCVYCNIDLAKASVTQDHVTPRCRGGGLLGQDNLEPACRGCNFDKGDKSLLTFLATR